MVKDVFEVLFGCIEMYNKMTKPWMEYTENIGKDKPEELLKAWSDSITGVYKDMTEMLAQSSKLPGIFSIMEKPPWGNAFVVWQQLMKEVPATRMPPHEGIEEFIKFSRGWQKEQMKLFDAWIDWIEKASKACKSVEGKGSEPEKVWKSCLESYQGLLEARISFATEQTKACFAFWESLMPKTKGPAKQGTAKTK